MHILILLLQVMLQWYSYSLLLIFGHLNIKYFIYLGMIFLIGMSQRLSFIFQPDKCWIIHLFSNDLKYTFIISSILPWIQTVNHMLRVWTLQFNYLGLNFSSSTN